MSQNDGSELQRIRADIDALDRAIVQALADRKQRVQRLSQLKIGAAQALRDGAREDEVLARLSAYAQERGLSAYFVRALYREIFEFSLRLQQHHVIDQQNPTVRAERRAIVSFQGAEGAYSQIAAERHFAAWDGEIETRGYDSFLGLLSAVSSGVADYGMLPVENTTAGSINEAYDLLAQTSLTVVGEEVLRVEHCLVGLADATIDGIRRVYSHPQALAQCSVFLSGLRDCAVQSFTDTAMSVKKVRDEGDASQAAVAGERAAALYGLRVLARNIENQKDNYTRFMVVARAPLRLDQTPTRLEGR